MVWSVALRWSICQVPAACQCHGPERCHGRRARRRKKNHTKKGAWEKKTWREETEKRYKAKSKSKHTSPAAAAVPCRPGYIHVHDPKTSSLGPISMCRWLIGRAPSPLQRCAGATNCQVAVGMNNARAGWLSMDSIMGRRSSTEGKDVLLLVAV